MDHSKHYLDRQELACKCGKVSNRDGPVPLGQICDTCKTPVSGTGRYLSAYPPINKMLLSTYNVSDATTQTIIDWLLDYNPSGSSIVDQMFLEDFLGTTLECMGDERDNQNPLNYRMTDMQADYYVGGRKDICLLLALDAPRKTNMSIEALLNLPVANYYALVDILKFENRNSVRDLDALMGN